MHGSLARAGKVRGQTPKVPKQEKKKQPKVRGAGRSGGQLGLPGQAALLREPPRSGLSVCLVLSGAAHMKTAWGAYSSPGVMSCLFKRAAEHDRPHLTAAASSPAGPRHEASQVQPPLCERGRWVRPQEGPQLAVNAQGLTAATGMEAAAPHGRRSAARRQLPHGRHAAA